MARHQYGYVVLDRGSFTGELVKLSFMGELTVTAARHIYMSGRSTT
jgi:hypothetical protein